MKIILSMSIFLPILTIIISVFIALNENKKIKELWSDKGLEEF